MGRSKGKNNCHRRKRIRRQMQSHQSTFGNDHNCKSHLNLNNTPSPLGAYIDMNLFTTIYLFTGDPSSRKEWDKIRLKLGKCCSKELIMDDVQKCARYIKQRHITHVFLQVFYADMETMKKIRETIKIECGQNQLIDCRINRVNGTNFGHRGICISSTPEHDDDYSKNMKQHDRGEMPVPIAIYGLTHGQQRSFRDLSVDEIRFMWFQLLLDVLLKLPKDTATMKDMLEVARSHYSTDAIELKKIDDFARSYNPTKAIWWYTQDSFVYRLLNIAFRTQDFRTIFTFRFFIIDLHTQLANAAVDRADHSWHTIFRGQMMSIDELNTIKNNIGGLISMNTFLSTTLDCQVACMYAGYGSSLPTVASVLFEINIDHADEVSLDRPFAFIGSFSDKHDENEILFSMGSIFRIESVEQYDSMCLVTLEIYTRPKQCISEFENHLRSKFVGRSTNELTLGDLLLEMGELKQAEQFYSIMIGQQNPDRFETEIALLQNSMSLWYIDRGDYDSARILLEQAVNINSGNQTLKSSLLNNIGLCWLNQDSYKRALKYFKRSKKYKRSKKELGVIYSNMSSAYIGIGQYATAKYFAQRALNIEKKNLPSFNPDLAKTYGHLAFIEQIMGNHAVALDLFKQELDMYKKCLPPDHHLFAHVLNNIGTTYQNMDEFDRALEYYEEALKIQSISFNHDRDEHPLVMATLNNIATCQFEKNDFHHSEQTFQRLLDTKLAIHGNDSISNSTIAIAYSNLAMAQMKQGHFDEALANYTRTLEIEESIGDLSSISVTYNNIGGVFHEKNDFRNAAQFYSKAYAIAVTVFPNDHPSVRMYAEHIQKVRAMQMKGNDPEVVLSGI